MMKKQNKQDLGLIKTVAGILLILSFIMSFSAINSVSADTIALRSNEADYLTGITGLLGLGGGFAETVSLSIDPTITLSVLSITGYLANAEVIDLGNSFLSRRLTDLPIANLPAAIFLTLIALTKLFLSSTLSTQIASDAFIAKAEHVVGAVSVCGISFLSLFSMTSFAAETAVILTPDNSVATALLTGISFITSFFSFITFFVIRVMIKGAEAAIAISSLFPGLFQFLQFGKNGLVITYGVLSVTEPMVSSVIGGVIVVSAFLLYRVTRRLERYFRRIYVAPFINSVFMFILKQDVPLVIKKTPSYIKENFPDLWLCQEAFVLGGVNGVAKRDMVYLVCSGHKTYLCRRRTIPWKWHIWDYPMEHLYGEKQFRFLMLYSGEAGHKKAYIKIVMRRELNKQYDTLMQMCRFMESPRDIEKREKKELKREAKEKKKEAKRLQKLGK
ncbi:MAG: hypothetical protein FWD34_09475 [Oscillospiraceae bacterium]|nr:hypothetical protein [Oscillospiraceae bacterium]